MRNRLWIPLVLLFSLVHPATAENKLVRLHAPENLVETGLLRHILPRFSLKTQVKVELVDEAGVADIVLGEDGIALFEGIGQVWHFALNSDGHVGTVKFKDWLVSDVGQRTIFGFAPEGVAVFSEPSIAEEAAAEVVVSEDAKRGHEVALAKCTRCHAVDKNTAWSSIGSSPSFAVLRSLDDWEDRFTAFYVLKPHPAFTQISEVTEPFPIDRPSPISPIELTLDEVDALISYVAAMQAADLGKPLEHQ